MDVKRQLENKGIKKIASAILLLLALFFGVDTLTELDNDTSVQKNEGSQLINVQQGESYDSLQEVVDYLHAYDELPPNYLTKKEAQALGWNASEGNLWDVASGMSIGGDYFGNFEGVLPEKNERTYQEADINYQGGYRGAERLVYSNDDLYFYTEDHYKSFTEIKPGGEIE